MDATRTPERTHQRLRPISGTELAGMLDALAETMAIRTGAHGSGTPCAVAPSDLLRCLKRLTSLN